MLQIKNMLGGGKPEGLYAWSKSEIGSELQQLNKSVSTLPYNFYYGSAVVLNGEIHILGGSVGASNHYKWDGTSWTKVSTLPYNFYQGSAIVLDGEIHILGPDNGNSEYKNHYKWDGNSWTSVSILPYNFYSGCAVVLDNEIHILGTSKSNGYYKAHYKWNGSSWTQVSTLPYNFYNGCAVVLDNEIHILGAYPTDCRTYHYKWNGSSWTSVSILPYNFYYGCAVVYNNEIHILGGDDGDKSHYKWDGTSWSSVNTLPYTFYRSCAIVFDNGIHILGSMDSSHYTKHYLIIGYVDVYTFLDYIVSDKETAYPDGGEKDGYWYEKVVEGAKVATGSFTVSNTSGNTNPINHNLGVKPTKLYLVNTVVTSFPSNSIIANAYYESGNGRVEILYMNTSGNISEGKKTPTVTDTTFTIPNYYLNGTYYWIAIAE